MALVGPFNGLFQVTDTAFTVPNYDSDRKCFASLSTDATTFTVVIGLPVGFSCSFVQQGSGALTIAAGDGVTINPVSTLTAAAQYTQMWLQSVAQDVYVLNQGT